MEIWAEVYNFPKEGRGHAFQTDKFAHGKFSTLVNPKDGYAMADCKDPRKKKVSEFIVPILYLEKPTWITVTLSNTIFGALSGVRKVSWGLVIQELVGKIISGLEKEKPSPINPYLFHLYNKFECLREREASMLDSARVMLEFDINSETEVQPNMKGKDSERKSLSSEEIQRLQTVSPGSRKKHTYRAIDGKTSIQIPNWREVAMTSFNFEDDPFWRIQEEVEQFQSHYSKLEYVTKEACKHLGDCKPIDLCKELEKIQQKDTVTLEANNATLATQVADLEVAIVKKHEEL